MIERYISVEDIRKVSNPNRDEGVKQFVLIRCKDCKYFDHSDFGKGEEYWCKHFVSTDDTTYCHKVDEDDFCAWGERREDANKR